MTTQTTGLRRLAGSSDVLTALAIVAVLGMMIVPMPDSMLDILIIVNIAMSLMILLVSTYVTEPLQISVFPSLLLLATLFRLGLNISSTRLVLTQAEAGRVIEAFGNVVIGGNYVVGAVVFIILTLVQFMVITNGAGRVSEVAARFTLDAMPGKQMAIDADLNAGLLTQDQAKQRRRDIQREADFYGAMDGASKFVKGDAIAGILITVINIIGGVIIGVLQLGIPLDQAAQTYTLLTIGDGLVSQIPALLISTATGIIVTRAASDGNLGSDLTNQLFGNPKVLGMVSGVLIALAMVPGFPMFPLLILGGGLGAAAYTVNKQQNRDAALAVQAAAMPPKAEPESINSLLTVDPMEIEIGYGLITLVEAGERGNLLDRIQLIRRQTALELGIVVPTVRIRDNLQLSPNTYVIRIRGSEVARGDLLPNHYLAMNPGLVTDPIDGINAREPAFGLPALWVSGAQREDAEIRGYTVVDPGSVLATHLTELIKSSAADLLGRQDVQSLLQNLKVDYPAVIDDLVPAVLTLAEVQKVLQNLLSERVSIRDLITVLETLGSRGRTTKDTDLLTEYARQAISRSICLQYQEQDNSLYVLTLAPQVETMLTSGLQQTDSGLVISVEPSLAQRMLQALVASIEKMVNQGHQPVVVCSPRIRLPLKRLTQRVIPHLAVLAYNELNRKVEVNAVGVVSVGDAA